MNVYVTTSDWYNPILPAFAHLFNRYWSPVQPVTVLGYSDPACELPPNFSFRSLGSAREFGNDVPEWSEGRRGRDFREPFPTPRWSDSLKRWLHRTPDPCFILMQIDYFIHRPVQVRQIDALQKCLADENVMKIDLSSDRHYFPHSHYCRDGDIDIVVSDQDAPYRASLQTAIWRREYLDAMLHPGRSPWDFERRGSEEHRNDGKLILGVAQPDFGPVPYLNVYGRGQVNWSELAQLDPAVRAELRERGWMGPHWNGWVDP